MRNIKLVSSRRNLREAGFTLVELLIAALVFTVVVGAAFTLFSAHQKMFNTQQNLAGLNIAMRNATAQIQSDVVNAGFGYYNNPNMPGWPVGIVIHNNVVSSGSDCHTGTTYGQNCFDWFTVITADPNTTPVNVVSSALPIVTPGSCTGASTQNISTSSSTNLYMSPPSGVTAATYAGNFLNGDKVMLVNDAGTGYTEVTLTANGTTQVSGGITYVKLVHTATTATTGANSATTDPTGLSSSATPSPELTDSFCATDWVVRLLPILYDVDISTPSNPTLRRTVLTGTNTASANGVALTNQVIGFKVGAALITSSDVDTANYNFDASTYASAYDFTSIRSIMVSLIGRTTPNPDPTFTFQNSFDSGHYQIQSASVVVNPRNLSMGD